jgi:hypothetical protein
MFSVKEAADVLAYHFPQQRNPCITQRRDDATKGFMLWKK